MISGHLQEGNSLAIQKCGSLQAEQGLMVEREVGGGGECRMGSVEH